MPFYEYECPNCGYRDEVLQKINDKPLKKCPTCGKTGLIKLMSAPVFRLKGKGWYETDFKSDKDKQRNLAGADKEESKAETKAEAKTDAKADAKPEAKVEAPKTETSKPAPAKSEKSVSARSKTKATPKRTSKRLSRR
jgi:putative FmdB family regulatory protein